MITTKISVCLKLITLLLFILNFPSCKEKYQHGDPEPGSVIITINAPGEANEYEKGDTIFINSHISSTNELHGYELHLVRLADTMELLNIEKDLHSANFDITANWVNDGHMHSDMELEITAVTGHGDPKVTRKVKFHCHSH